MEEAKRIYNTLNDLIVLDKKQYCDLGPGVGYLSIELKKNNRNVIAVEAPWALENNKSWASENDIKMYFIEFFTGDFSVIEENVDCFVLAHSIAHFRFTPNYVFEKIYQKLPKGGLFYLSTVNATAFERVLGFMKGKPVVEPISKGTLPEGSDYIADFNKTGLKQIWDDWMHVKEYTKDEIENIFRNAGFEIERSFHRNNYTHWKKNWIIKLFPHLSEEIVVIGRKN